MYAVAAVVLVVLFAGCQLLRLRQQRDRLWTRFNAEREALQLQLDAERRAKFAWKDHAIALETVMECKEEVDQVCRNNPSSTRRERQTTHSQLNHAETAACRTTAVLFDLGEWPDAEESAFFCMIWPDDEEATV